MRSDARWVVALAASAVVACGGSSQDSLFTGGHSPTGSGGAVTGTGGSSMNGAGGQTPGNGGDTSAGGAGFGGFGVGGSISTGGVQNLGGFGNGGALVDAGAGGFIGFGGDGSGGFSFGGEGTAGGPDGVVCGNSQCTADQQCCVAGNTRTCEASGASCCTGIACTTTPVTCDSQSDCTGGEICCANVTVGFASRVTSIKCQATCGSALTQYVLCDPSGPDICTGGTSCSQGLLITSYYFCQ